GLRCQRVGGAAHRRERGDAPLDQIVQYSGQPFVLPGHPAILDRDIAPLDVAGFGEPPEECGSVLLSAAVGSGSSGAVAAEIADHRHRRPLRARRQPPRRGRAAEYGEELAPSHGVPPYSITSSASANIEGGMVSPRSVAALSLMTSSNLVGVCTGRSAGLAPLRMRST